MDDYKPVQLNNTTYFTYTYYINILQSSVNLVSLTIAVQTINFSNITARISQSNCFKYRQLFDSPCQFMHLLTIHDLQSIIVSA